MSDRTNIVEAKRRLPLPELMAQLGDGDRAKPSARCPFHDDKTPSFSTFQKEGSWFWKCHSSNCGSGDEIDYLAKRRGLQNGSAIAEFLKLAGVARTLRTAPSEARHDVFNWSACVDAFTEADALRVAEWRGLSLDFVRWLHANGTIGSFEKLIAFPNHDDAGEVVSAHHRLASGKWKFKPTGRATAPLCFGDVAQVGFVLCFESQWDAFAAMDRLGWHLAGGIKDTAVLITRGTSNGKLCKGKFKPDAKCYAFKQNDEPTADKPIPAADVWLADVVANAGCRVLNVATPAPHADLNDWTRAGATKEDIESAISRSKVCKAPPVETMTPATNTADVRGDLLATLTDKTLSTEAKRTKAAQLVVAALNSRGRFYFHAERKDFETVMFFDTERKRLERIRGDSFKGWLSDWLRVNRADGTFNYLCAGIETAALSGETTTGILPDAFWASREGAVYLSNGDGQVVKITGADVALVDNGTDGVLFPAGRTLKPWRLIEPVSAFETCAIFRDVRCAATHGKDLVQLLVYSLPTDPRTKPAACFSGTVGSGKTRTAKAIAELFGLPQVVAKVEESGEDDFWPMLDAGGLVILDNADTRNKWLPDALAAAATDGCTQRRKLYTNAETVTMRARAWCVVTSANPTFASDAGLADRLLVVRMERSEGATSDAALSAEIEANRDAALSHIAETIRLALADSAPTPPGLNQRHPDFATFAVKLGRALGREAEAVAALRTAEADKSAFCIENDSIGAPLKTFLDAERSFNGTAAELLDRLRTLDADMEEVSTKRLSKRIAKLWPHLKALFSAKEEVRHGGAKVYRFKSGDFGDFETAFSGKSPSKHTRGLL